MLVPAQKGRTCKVGEPRRGVVAIPLVGMLHALCLPDIPLMLILSHKWLEQVFYWAGLCLYDHKLGQILYRKRNAFLPFHRISHRTLFCNLRRGNSHCPAVKALNIT